MKRIITESDLKSIAQKIIDKVEKTKSTKAKVIALHGDLGAGKTTLTKQILSILNPKAKTKSPTFVIMRRFDIDYKKISTVIHIDAYRLKNAEDLVKLGFKEILEDPKNLIILEWPEIVSKLLPKNTLHIFLKHRGREGREVLL